MFNCDTGPMERAHMMHGNQFIIGLRERFEVARKAHDLKKVELQIISYLSMATDEDNTSSDIVRNLHMNKAMVSKTLDTLNKRGLVEFRTDAKDRRYVHYFTTDQAQPILDSLSEAWEYTKQNLFKGLEKSEIDEFFRITRIMHSNMLEMQEKEGKS